jgi:hypothetical protein
MMQLVHFPEHRQEQAHEIKEIHRFWLGLFQPAAFRVVRDFLSYFVVVNVVVRNCCCRRKVDQPCRLKTDQGWRPRAVALGVFGL